MNIRAEECKAYQINAYRVLLTRARQGMVSCVPEGNPNDATRFPVSPPSTTELIATLKLLG